MNNTDPQIVVSLAPQGPLVLLNIGAFAAAGKFFGGLLAWFLVRFHIIAWLGIAMEERELRDELEYKIGLLFGSVYLVFWVITLLDIGPIL